MLHTINQQNYQTLRNILNLEVVGRITSYNVCYTKLLRYYVSATVEEEGVQKQVFLEYLVNGMADLYYLRNENSETYYIRKAGEDALAITDIRLLKAAFSDCYEIQSRNNFV